MANPVRYFHNNMQGAPTLGNNFGDMTALLDACLVNGFNLKTITSITSAAGIATVTIAAGHLYEVDQVLRIAGATQTEYNGDVRVLSTTATTFTYAITGTPASPATGATITAKAAPLDFTIAFTGTNKRAYRSTNVASNRPYLRVDDGQDPVWTATYAKYAKVTIAQGMSDIDTFVGARAPYSSTAPTQNEAGTGAGTTAVNGWFKWYYARSEGNPDTTAPAAGNRGWVLIGDDRGFYLFNENTPGGGLAGKCFTDFDSWRAADGFNTLLCASERYAAASTAPNVIDSDGSNSPDHRSRFPRSNDTIGKVLMRDHTQVGNYIGVGFTTLNTNNTTAISGSVSGVPWPNGADYGLVVHPIMLKQSTGHLRGRLPGMYWIINEYPNIPHLGKVYGASGLNGRTLMLSSVMHGTSGANNGASLMFDITGPWW